MQRHAESRPADTHARTQVTLDTLADRLGARVVNVTSFAQSLRLHPCGPCSRGATDVCPHFYFLFFFSFFLVCVWWSNFAGRALHDGEDVGAGYSCGSYLAKNQWLSQPEVADGAAHGAGVVCAGHCRKR